MGSDETPFVLDKEIHSTDLSSHRILLKQVP